MGMLERWVCALQAQFSMAGLKGGSAGVLELSKAAFVREDLQRDGCIPLSSFWRCIASSSLCTLSQGAGFSLTDAACIPLARLLAWPFHL